MAQGCVDCGGRSRSSGFGDGFTETFPVPSPGGPAVHLTLRLCLRCGRRFPDRTQLREYLRTRLPSDALQGVPAVIRS